MISQAQIPDSISWVVPSSSAEILWQLWVKEEYADAVADSGITNVGGISFPAWAFSDAPGNLRKLRVNCSPKNIAVQDLTFTSGMTSDDVQQNTKDLIQRNSDMDLSSVWLPMRTMYIPHCRAAMLS